MKYSFINDYSEGCAKEILDALIKYNYDQDTGYGLDKHCLNAEKLIKKATQHEDIDVHFLTGGTPCNVTAISLLRSNEAVISCKSGHINVHETGAVEHIGHKIITVNGIDGKITANEIIEICKSHSDEHMVKPKMVFVSLPSELGTIYSLKELKEIRKVCTKYNLYLYIDGARLGSALTSKKADFTLKDITDLADIYYIGGTKNGALLGEAMVIKNEYLKKDFRFFIKQNDAMLAKGRLIGISFEEFFKGDLYYRLAKNANDSAELIRNTLLKKKVKMFSPSYTNQIFPVLKNSQIKQIENQYGISLWAKVNEKESVIRLVTSWNTTKDKVLEFIDFLNKIL